MQSWSYLTLAVANGKPHTRNGERVTGSWATVTADEYLAQLGLEGWELVAVNQVTIKDFVTTWLYFKQPMTGR